MNLYTTLALMKKNDLNTAHLQTPSYRVILLLLLAAKQGQAT